MPKQSKSITTDGVKLEAASFNYFINMVKCHYDFIDTPEVDLLEEELPFFIDAYNHLLEYLEAHPHSNSALDVVQTVNGIIEILSVNKRLSVDSPDDYAVVLASYLDLRRCLTAHINVTYFDKALKDDTGKSINKPAKSINKPAPLGDTLYVIDFGDVVKVGRSINPVQRMRTITTSSGRHFRGGYLAKGCGDLERQAHSVLHKFRTVGEFFNCDVDTAMDMLECFGLEWQNHCSMPTD